MSSRRGWGKAQNAGMQSSGKKNKKSGMVKRGTTNPER